MPVRTARKPGKPGRQVEPALRPAPPPAAREVRILIVDDDEATGEVMKAALARPEFRIRVVTEPDILVRQLQTSPQQTYHLIVLDYVLPGLESDTVFEWIRDFQPEAAIIVVTGYPSMDSAVNCLRAHIYDYLTKPFEIAEFQRIVVRCLAERGLLRMTEEGLRDAIGAAIRDRRKLMRLTLAQVASRSDVSIGYLSQIELGRNSASVETLYRICLGLGMSLADLFENLE